MIEKIVLDYLTEKLDVPVFAMQPDDAPDSFVLIEKVGGSVDNYIATATIAVQSYGASLYQASLLNEEVITEMAQIVALESIGRCKLESTYNFTDLVRHKPRYQAVFDMRYY